MAYIEIVEDEILEEDSETETTTVDLEELKRIQEVNERYNKTYLEIESFLKNCKQFKKLDGYSI